MQGNVGILYFDMILYHPQTKVTTSNNDLSTERW